MFKRVLVWKISFIKKNLTLIAASIVISSMCLWPAIKEGTYGIFYSIDPDVHYLSNALSFITRGKIYYIDHPGTPAIMLQALLLFPLSLAVKIITGSQFKYWAFNNIGSVYYYSRIFQSIIFTIGIFIFLYSLKRVSKFPLGPILGLSALLTFTPFYYFGSAISPETTSFTIVSVWVLIYTFFRVNLKTKIIYLLCFISGIAIANKFTNLFLAVASVLLFFSIKKTNILLKLLKLIAGLSIVGIGFAIGTIPISDRYPALFRWISTLGTSSGIHGQGEKTIFNPKIYWQSLKTQTNIEKVEIPIFLIVSLFSPLSAIGKKENLLHSDKIISAVFLGGMAIFAKYPLAHYQIANLTLLVFISVIILSRFKRNIILLCTVLLLPTGVSKYSKYIDAINTEVSRSANLEKYIETHPANSGTLWEWGKSKDFVLIWGRVWAKGLFADEMYTYRPNLLELGPDLRSVIVQTNKKTPLLATCWDKLYIQEASVPVFLEKNTNESFEFTKITGTQMGVITSNHCLNKH